LCIRCRSTRKRSIKRGIRHFIVIIIIIITVIIIYYVLLLLLKFHSICIVHQVLLHNMRGGQGHLERFLPKAKAPCLSESVQGLYTQHNPNTDRSFQLEKHFVKIARALRTMKDRGGIRA
jgi:hypothetical protein